MGHDGRRVYHRGVFVDITDDDLKHRTALPRLLDEVERSGGIDGMTETDCMRIAWRKHGAKKMVEKAEEARATYLGLKNRTTGYGKAVKALSTAYFNALEAFEESWERSNEKDDCNSKLMIEKL